MDQIQDRIKACISAHPDWDARRINRAIVGSHMMEVRALLSGEASPAGPADESKVGGSITLSEVKSKLDTAAAIKREISKIRTGHLLPEDELLRLTAGRDRNRFRRAVDNNPDLARRHRVKLRLDDSGDGKFYWGREADIAEAVRIRDL